MSVVKKTGRAKQPYTFTISTGKKLANGKYELIFGPYFATKKEAQEAEATAKAQRKAEEAMTAEEKEEALG